LLSFFASRFSRSLWESATDARFFSRITPELAEVFAGSLLDRHRLVTPGGATAGIDAACILQ